MKIFYIFLFILTVFFNISEAQDFDQNEIQSLLNIDNNCDVSDNLNWDPAIDPSNWTGVEWNNNDPRQVVRIDLSEKELSGELNVSSFEVLEELNCNSNNLTGLNITNSSSITRFSCNKNQIVSLNINNLPDLVFFDCSLNKLTTLDKNPILNTEYLNCQGNKILIMDFSDMPNLKILDCSVNWQESLEIANLPQLQKLMCWNNRLKKLDVTNLLKLTYIYCSNGLIEKLDVSPLTELNTVICSDNKIDSLDFSNAKKISSINCQGDELVYLNITNLTNLKKLYCDLNKLSTLNLENLTELITLDCGGNQLSQLDLSDQLKLTSLDCGGNELVTLNTKKLNQLVDLLCGSNNLTSLELSPSIKVLYCQNNELTSLDLSELDSLIGIDCNNNNIKELDVSNKKNLSNLTCYKNQITDIKFSENTSLKAIFCHDNKITNLDLSSLVNLNTLFCADNNLFELDASMLEKIYSISCRRNYLPFSSIYTIYKANAYEYSPQYPLYNQYTYAGDVLIDYSKEALINGSQTTFEFYKDRVLVETNTSGQFQTIGTGVYYCQMMNSLFPNIHYLRTQDITIIPKELNVSVTELEIGPNEGDTAVFEITSNTNWEITHDKSWFSIDIMSDTLSKKIKITAEANRKTPRDASIIISSPGIPDQTILLSQDIITSVEKMAENDIRIFPNPAKNHITLSEYLEVQNLSIYSIEGMKLISINHPSEITDISNLSNGLYLVNITKNNTPHINKIIIKR